MKYSKAEIALVDFGFCQMNGLMAPDGNYYIAIVQSNDFLKFSAYQNHAVRTAKTLLGAGFAPTKMATELNSNKVWVMTIEDFKRLVRKLDQQGNPTATAFVDASLEEAIERRFDIAFGIKRTEEERNFKMALRVKRVQARYDWTDTLKARHVELYGCPPSSDQYKDWTVKANLALFGRPHFCCDRDTMTIKEQMQIENFEFLCCRWSGKYPQETPDQVLSRVLATY